MHVIEQFCQGKTANPDLNEDKIVVSEHFIAVIDGATARGGGTFRGKTPGRFAADVVGDALLTLQPHIQVRQAVDMLTAVLRAEAHDAATEEGRVLKETWDFPAAALLVYSAARREIWRVADSTFAIDGKADMKVFPQEEIWCQLRHAFLHGKMARGFTLEQMIENDPSWEFLTPLIAEFKVFANYAGPYGYSVINGTPVPDNHIGVYPVPDGAKEIIFASDGYPEVHGTLAETEARMMQIVREDPLMMTIHPQVKGVRKGNSSFDDRSYIRFSL